MGSYELLVEENVSKALEHLKEAVRICEESKDNVSLGFACWRLGLALSYNCEFEKAAHYYEKALDIMAAANNVWGASVAKSYLSNFAYFWKGRVDLAYQTSHEAVQLAEESGDIYSKAIAYTVHGASFCGKGFLEEAIKHLSKGVEFCEKINLFIWNGVAQWWLGRAFHEMGEYQNSRKHYARTLWLVEHSRSWFSWMTLTKLELEMTKVMLGEKNIDLESLYVYVYENKLKFFEALKQRSIGKILLNIDDQHFSEAEDWIKKAIETGKRYGMRWHLGWDHALYADLLKRKGDKSKSKENLIKAIEIFQECGADGRVKKTEKELDSLS
jgi:tetratricopeptide (TPR) repeat protein